jgi:SMC interacting uncharacterized protein involved in chromosome segregation
VDSGPSSSEVKSAVLGSGAAGVHHLCFRIDGVTREVWARLSKVEKISLTKFFRDVIVNYTTVRGIIGVGVKDFAELASILKLGYESCKEALRVCEERSRDIENMRSEYREKMKQYEEVVEQLKLQIEKKDAEIAKLRSYIQSMAALSKLKLLVCTLKDHDKELEEELEKYGLSNICQ